MKGKLYGVGVGPGDPELITIKALRLTKEADLLAFPGEDPEESVAYKIMKGAYPEISFKEKISLPMPMTKEKEELKQVHDEGARIICSYLDQGKNIVFLTLGDPCVYSTFSYLQHRVEADGYHTELVSGITSFCAAAARLNISLSEWNEQLHIVPAVHRLDNELTESGNYILMKSGKKMNQVKEILARSGKDVLMVENCGMPDEHIYHSVEEIPDDAGYYSLIIAKEHK